MEIKTSKCKEIRDFSCFYRNSREKYNFQSFVKIRDFSCFSRNSREKYNFQSLVKTAKARQVAKFTQEDIFKMHLLDHANMGCTK